MLDPNEVERRARELGVGHVRQGVHDKVAVFESLLVEVGVGEQEVGFVGDDVVDIPLLRRAGFAAAVADATPETRAAAHYITRLPGGFGAVREVCELILKARGDWDAVMRLYTG